MFVLVCSVIFVMWSYTTMIHIPFICFCLTTGRSVSSSLRILDKRTDCSREGLNNCQIYNCSDKHMVVARNYAPLGPDWDPEQVGVWMDEHGPLPVVNVTWKIRSDGGAHLLVGSEINILDESTNQTLCFQFSYKLGHQRNPNQERWDFSLAGVVVEPGHTYMVSVFNLPEPVDRDYRISKKITIPGCDDKRIKEAQMCQENGSLWDPGLSTTLSLNKKQKKFSIVVGFEAAQYSERYQVSIQNHDLHYSKNVSKENRTWLNVTFELGWWQVSQCEMSVTVQSFFVRCKNDCQRSEKTHDFCSYYSKRTFVIKAVVGLHFLGCLAYLLWRGSYKDSLNISTSDAQQQPQGFQVHHRKRVLVIYSLDHPLYKNIVLKLCAFLATKCGTEVVLDLLDSARLGVLGSIQWLDWHREQIESSSDKILILCSRGVQAKWRAMCGDGQVFLREDARSPVGDMLSPALSLMVPQFIRSSSFEKYIIAYFDNVCSEEDVPSPFNITVRYKLMKQFEELFFRILDAQKHEPGRVNCIEGLSEDEYYRCPTGAALRDAIEAFHAHQLGHPQWFEDELLESPNAPAEICGNAKTPASLITYSVTDSIQLTSHENTRK